MYTSTESTSPTLSSVPEQSTFSVQPRPHLETPATASTDLPQLDSSPPDPNNQFSQTLVDPAGRWQQNLMIKYGNTSLVDATYKTTKYNLPRFFFVTVRTNIGYKVVARFIVQSETTEQILEALNMLKNWNKEWKPPFILCDYSEAEISAIEQAFPGITVYINFVISIVNKHGLGGQETTKMGSTTVGKLMCLCMGTISRISGLSHDAYYQQVVTTLKQSPNISVQWLSKTWLCIPQVRQYPTCTHILAIVVILMMSNSYDYKYTS